MEWLSDTIFLALCVGLGFWGFSREQSRKRKAAVEARERLVAEHQAFVEGLTRAATVVRDDIESVEAIKAEIRRQEVIFDARSKRQ